MENPGLRCPVCDAPETYEDEGGTTLLNIRGFKVSDCYGHWSKCLNAHSLIIKGEIVHQPAADKYDRQAKGGLWFVELEDPHTGYRLEINGRHVHQGAWRSLTNHAG